MKHIPESIGVLATPKTDGNGSYPQPDRCVAVGLTGIKMILQGRAAGKILGLNVSFVSGRIRKPAGAGSSTTNRSISFRLQNCIVMRLISSSLGSNPCRIQYPFNQS